MPRLLICVICLLVSVITIRRAHADSFTYTLFGTGFLTNGVLPGTADPYHSSASDVTAPSMTPNGSNVPTGLTGPTDVAHPSVAGNFTFDNGLYTSEPTALDQNGLLLSLGGGAALASALYRDTYRVALQMAGDPGAAIDNLDKFESTQTDPSRTPEPSTLLLLGTGALLLSALIRRKPAF